MQLTIKRYGGIVPTKSKTSTFDLESLDDETLKALSNALNSPETEERHPDGFEYSFEIQDPSNPNRQITLPGTLVPEELRKLLP
jgi:hypothetical protein